MNTHRESAAELMAMPLDQLHDLPGCQCPEHQPWACCDTGRRSLDPNADLVSLADHTASAIEKILGA